MKILLVHNRYQERGGEDSVAENEWELLKEKGHDVELAEVSNDSIQGVLKKVKTAWSTPSSKTGYQWMADHLERFKPQVVHVHNFFPLLSPSIFDACEAQNIPTVLTLHNFRLTCSNGLLLRDGEPCELCVDGSPYQSVVHGCYRGSRLASLPVARMISKHRSRGTWKTQVGRFIALSQFSKRVLVRSGIPENKIQIKPNFLPTLRAQRFIRPRRKRNSTPIGLYVGRLSEEKGIRTALEAWSSPPCRLRIVGSGPLEYEVRSNHIWGIDYLGKQTPEQVALCMASADFLVVPSICYENFPMVVLEAFASGLPVIVSGHGGLSDLVKDRETGLHFKPGDPLSLREAILELLDDPVLWNRMSAAAHAQFHTHFTAEANYPILSEIYKTVIASGKSTGLDTPCPDSYSSAHASPLDPRTSP